MIIIFKLKERLATILAMFSALAGLNALLVGVIPSIRFDGYGEPIGFFDVIQFLPSIPSVFAILAMSAIITAVIFSFIKAIPRVICLIINGVAFLSSFIAVLTVDIEILYRNSGIPAGNLPADRGINYGVTFTFVIFVFLLFCFAAAVLSFVSVLAEKKSRRMHRRGRSGRRSSVHGSGGRYSVQSSDFKPSERLD